MKIKEDFVREGHFWLPESSDQKLSGKLTVKSGGEARLEILGHFGSKKDFFTNDNPNVDRIVGMIEGGKYVTLDNCFYTNRNISFGGISKSIIFANLVLVGIGLDVQEEIKFDKIRFSIEGLDEWVSISGINVDTDFKRKSANISYQPPDEISIKLHDDIKLSFIFNWTAPACNNITEAKISQKVYVRIESKKHLNLSEFRNLIFKFNNFLCFAIDDTVCLTEVIAYSSKWKYEVDGKFYDRPIQLYYQGLPYSEKTPSTKWHTMLFNYHKISGDFENILQAWLRSYELIEPAFNLYFTTKSGAHNFVDSRFLSLAQGIETFHRRTSDELNMDKDEFNKLVKIIVEGCPDDKKKWLKGRLTYANEIPLRKRLKSLVEPFKDYVGTCESRKTLINKIIDTRNYLTHYDKSLERKAAAGTYLLELCLKLECLFQLHFMKQIGFTDEEIALMLDNNYKLKQKFNLFKSAKKSRGKKAKVKEVAKGVEGETKKKEAVKQKSAKKKVVARTVTKKSNKKGSSG